MCSSSSLKTTTPRVEAGLQCHFLLLISTLSTTKKNDWEKIFWCGSAVRSSAPSDHRACDASLQPSHCPPLSPSRCRISRADLRRRLCAVPVTPLSCRREWRRVPGGDNGEQEDGHASSPSTDSLLPSTHPSTAVLHRNGCPYSPPQKGSPSARARRPVCCAPPSTCAKSTVVHASPKPPRSYRARRHLP
jgi:hypothetical protein